MGKLKEERLRRCNGYIKCMSSFAFSVDKRQVFYLREGSSAWINDTVSRPLYCPIRKDLHIYP